MFKEHHDSGKTRQFYQILTAFIPGQTYNYSPIIKSGKSAISPNLTVITKRISNVDYIEKGKDEAIRFWSGDNINASIKEYSGKEDINNLNLIGIKPAGDKRVKVSLDVFPKTFTLKGEEEHLLSWNRSFVENASSSGKENGKPLRISQAQFVFCDNKGRPAIREFRIRDRDSVRLLSKEEENWSNQRIIVGTENYPLSSEYAENLDFDQILKEYKSYPSAWKFKPRLSSSITVFMPIPFADVFYPKIENVVALFDYAMHKQGIKVEEVDDKEGIDMIRSYLADHYIPPSNNRIKKNLSDPLAEKIISIAERINEPGLKENYKLSKIENQPTARKKDPSGHPYLHDYGLLSVTYLEPLECVNSCIGWITGKTTPGIGENCAILRPITVDKEDNGIVYNQMKQDWTVIYTITKSEGIVFRFGEKCSYEAMHTFSHLLLKTIPGLSGIEEGQLSEQIFEWANAVLIYSNEPGEFRTYGLKHVFENSLRETLESARDFMECPFEQESNGCYYCLHQPVVCSHFNARLDKDKLKKYFKKAKEDET